MVKDTLICLSIQLIHNFNEFSSALKSRQKSYEYCRHFIAIDVTYLTGKFRMRLLLTVIIDPAAHNVLLGWSVVESQNESSWDECVRQLQLAIPAIQTEQTTLISNHAKRPIKASEMLAPLVFRTCCC